MTRINMDAQDGQDVDPVSPCESKRSDPRHRHRRDNRRVHYCDRKGICSTDSLVIEAAEGRAQPARYAYQPVAKVIRAADVAGKNSAPPMGAMGASSVGTGDCADIGAVTVTATTHGGVAAINELGDVMLRDNVGVTPLLSAHAILLRSRSEIRRSPRTLERAGAQSTTRPLDCPSRRESRVRPAS